ncbi:MAG: host cell division inhibitor Icd-like protein [Lonepinella koalarum]|nr:host cell division inhibitor Icd-like protein [Lonepinella koalarum]
MPVFIKQCYFSKINTNINKVENISFLKSENSIYSTHAVAKSTAEPANSNNQTLANSSTPLTRAFFVRSTRTPKERHKKACSSMVACSGKGSPFAVFQSSQFCSPLHVTAQPLQSLAVAPQNLTLELSAMMYQFIFAAIRRTDLTNQIHKIRISATSELEARKALARDFVLVLAGRINLQNNAKTDRTFSNQCLPVIENGCNIRGTTTKSGHRTRKTCGIFLPQNHIYNTAQNGAFCSFIEFAVRLRDRTKALSTNKIRRLFAVVDTLPPLKQGDTSNTVTKRENPMKTPQKPTALYAENSPILSTFDIVGGCNG